MGGLRDKVKSGLDGYSGDKNDEKAVLEAVLAPVAKEAGFDFTYEDMAKLAASSGDDELSEEELTAAVGGWAFCIGIGFGKGITTVEDTDKGYVMCSVIGYGVGYAP